VKRVLAIIGAALMITIAFVIRSSRESDNSSSATNGNGNPSTVTIACVPELEAQCTMLEGPGVTVNIQDAADTAQKLKSGDAGIDAWFTLAPWPAITNELAKASVIDDGTPVASAGLVIASVKERADVLAKSCPGGRLDWKCVIDANGKAWSDLGGNPAWGTVKVGLPPKSTALGLLLNGNAVAGYFDKADIATNDFSADPNFAAWRSKLDKASTNAQAFTQFVQQFPAAFSAVGASSADASGLGERAGQVAIAPGSPEANAVAVLAPVTGSTKANKIADLAKNKALVQAFSNAGWSVPAQPDAGLPDPGVLLALSGLAG
jgi:hypothetical protein